MRARMHRRRLASGLAACGLVLSTIGLVGPRVAASGPFEAPEPAVVMRPFAVEVVPADLGWARVASTFGASGATAPHGGSSAQTSLCGYCHRSHQAPTPNLHPYLTERETCYQCHNGGRAAGAGVNEIQRVLIAVTTLGTDTFTLSFRGDTTGPIATPPTAGAIDVALETLPTVNVGTTPSDNVLVTENRAGTDYDVTFKSALGNTDVQQLTGSATFGSVMVTTTAQGRTGLLPGATNDILGAFGEGWPIDGASTRASFHPVPESSDGFQIGCLDCHSPHLDPAEYPQLLRRPDGSGGWLYSPVSGPDIGNRFCYLSCHDGSSPYPAPFDDRTGFEGTAHDTVTVPTADEIQRVAVDATGGTFTLTFAGSTTVPLAHDVSVAGLRTALEALPGIAVGNVDVTGGPGDAGATSPYGVAFQAALAATDVPGMTAGPTLLTGSARTAVVTTVMNGRPSQPSGGIACLNCHDPHGSDLPRLVDASEEMLCFSCHTQDEPNTSGGPSPIAPSNPYEAFNDTSNDYTQDADGVRLFHHPVSGADQPGSRRVECASCHNTHLADSVDTGSTSKLVDPADVRTRFIVTWEAGSFGQRGNISTFCAKCHISPTTTQPLTATADGSIPYTIEMVNDTGANNDGGSHPHDGFSWDYWLSSDDNIHGPAGADFACTACHDFHGSSNAFMLNEEVIALDSPGDAVPDGTVTTVTGWQDDQSIAGDADIIRSFCQACHGAGTHNDGQGCTRCHYHGSSADFGDYTGW